MPLSHITSLIHAETHCVLAFSGGLDSTVLLHQLMCWKNEQRISSSESHIRVLHIHHGLSPNADDWALHCKQICEKWKVPYEVLHVKINLHSSSSIEAAARDVRYQVLFEKLRPGECLLTAQHLDDQCETILLALKRGSGPTGLAGMSLKRRINGYLHLRPFLNLSREYLEAYAKKHQLSWINDESNVDNCYDRVFLRLHIIPLLKKRWPYFNKSTLRSAALCAEQEQLLDELLAGQLEKLIDEQGALYFIPLLAISEVHRHALLRRWIAIQGGKMPSREALKRITFEVMRSRKDAQPRLRCITHEVRRYRQKLYWLPQLTSLNNYILIWADRNQPLCLPQNLGYLQANNNIVQFRFPTNNEQITIRFVAHGYYNILGRFGRCKMKKLWQELGVPPWQRQRIPLIYYNEELIGSPELFTTFEGISKDKQGWKPVWIKTIKSNCKIQDLHGSIQ
ncbi:hypothetical protein HHS_04320 [Candidatus Pantoea carbekii]|uniref:tRNA(Ile)-lysidine synthase n=2 Tax=Candidatus Pantoea carbekii TaxID=1235990 RepID=U3U7L1_9GAMM|nr:hypothetical protein HHS_04320 [Candidatus Pantoea carbekii]